MYDVQELKKAGMSQFGSGWAWLVCDPKGEHGFYSGSYPPNCWRGIFTLVPNTKRDTELAKRALLAEKREKHLGR